jgi:hypothetical protein
MSTDHEHGFYPLSFRLYLFDPILPWSDPRGLGRAKPQIWVRFGRLARLAFSNWLSTTIARHLTYGLPETQDSPAPKSARANRRLANPQFSNVMAQSVL